MEDYSFGSIIGYVEIVDCVINHPSIWAEKSIQLSKPIYKEYYDRDGWFDNVKYNNDKIDWINKNPTYNWVLANPVKFAKPIPAKGKLSFWDYPITDEECLNLEKITL